MAPSTVFSYLRGQHRRGSSTSNPPSPLPPSSQHSADSPLQVPDGFYHSPDDRSASVDPSTSPRPHLTSGWEPAYNWDRVDRGGASKLSSDSDSRPAQSGARRIPSSPLMQSRPASAASDSPKPLSASGPLSSISNHSLAPPYAHFFGLNREYGISGQSRSTEKLSYYENVSRAGPTPQAKSPSPIASQIPRTGKARLNLLNPMSLLARRRSSQTLNQQTHVPAPIIQNITIPAVPNDYDPRIRGHVVHDFSNPRPRRNYSSNDASLPPFDLGAARPGFLEAGRRHSNVEAIYDNEPRHKEPTPVHTPLFTEHFNDDSLTPETASPRFSPFDLPPPDREPPPLPPFAKNLPADIPSLTDRQRQETAPVKPTTVSQPLAVVPEAESPSTSQSSSPPRGSTSDISFHPTVVPKRLASNASRFSFDLGGAGSAAQEKILEEKHKQKEAEKKAAKRYSRDDESDEGDFDYDNMMDDDGLEEKIPGVNADLDDGYDNQLEEPIPGLNADSDKEDGSDEETPPVNTKINSTDHDELDKESSGENGKEERQKPGDLEGFRFTPAMASATSPTSTIETGRTSQATPRDELGDVIGFAMSKESPQQGQRASLGTAFPTTSTLALQNGLGLISLGGNDNADQEPEEQLTVRQTLYEEDDDLYFDDGLIDHPPDDAEGERFDEAVFDDVNSNLYERRPLSQLQNRTISPDQPTSDSDAEGYEEEFSPVHVNSAIPQTLTKAGIPRGFWASTHQHPSISYALASEPSGLTEDNLAAYHDALATAANEAAANGRFVRKASVSQASETTSQMDDGNPGLISDESRTSRGLDSLRPFSNDHLKNDFSYEDAGDLDDDAIIAAANADALENDDEGFYGQEFGFYARANGNCNSELVNGGYFGSRGVEGISRSHSGRVDFREPNLTPITERSEWSARTSVISLPTLGIPQALSAHTVPSPGLAQLAGMEDFEDDMSFSALMKLRRGAFGGSNGSLRSSAASQASGTSPLTHFPPGGGMSGPGPYAAGLPTTAAAPAMGMGVPHHHPTSSTYSLTSSTGLPNTNGIPEEAESDDDIDDNASPASPTLTIDNNVSSQSPEFTFPPTQSQTSPHSQQSQSTPIDMSPSPMRKGAIRGRGHSRGSSGAESVSYVKEMDADGGGSGRWILERRRTGEGGEMEVIGREVVGSGRI